MKVCIVTLYNNVNFGNRLQNFALQKAIEKFNIECYSLKNTDLTIKRVIKESIKKIILKKNKLERKRNKNFVKFSKNIRYTRKTVNYNSKFKNQITKYDFYITGSDQVWNPQFNKNGHLNFNLLHFVEPSKRIAYAASFGQNKIDKEYNETFDSELKKFKSISVREDSGKDIIKRINSSLRVEVLIDPTMLIEATEWEKYMKKPQILKNNKYILNYFLGDLSDNRKRIISKFAKENNCEIIDILDKKSPFYQCGPSEFLYLEKNAYLICTDSFHSSVFALLFNRPFVIFDRKQKEIKSMNSRIDTLLSKFEIENRKFNGKCITKENINHNYQKAYKILEEERKKSICFLKKSLDIQGVNEL